MKKFITLLVLMLTFSATMVFSQSKTLAKLLYQGHGSYRITSAKGIVIYIDPKVGTGYNVPADFIFFTNSDYDKKSLNRVKKEAGCKVYYATNFVSNGNYGIAKFNGIKVQAVPAFSIDHKTKKGVGYVITLENNISIYCAGCTSYTDYMEKTLSKMQLDYALLPCDGVSNMDAIEASYCAQVIGAKQTIPIHTRIGVLFDPKVAARFDAPGALILKPGQEIDLVK